MNLQANNLSLLILAVRAALAEKPGIDDPVREARVLIMRVVGITAADMIARPDMVIDQSMLDRVQNVVDRRAKGEPLSRILGLREFYGLDFVLSPDTLDPRPETEILVDLAMTWLHQNPHARSMLDLGTGTGCIPIALLAHVSDLHARAVDVAPGAVQAAIHNAQIHNVNDRFHAVVSNWFAALNGMTFDLITSNPPYIPAGDVPGLDIGVKNHDPILALAGGDDGLDPYRIIFTEMKNYLRPGGVAMFEFGIDQVEGITRLAEKSGLDVRDVTNDYAGIPRVITVGLTD